VPALEPEIRKRVAEVLPAFAPTRNPLDTTGQVTVDPSIFGRLAEVAADSRRIDCILVAVSTMMGAAADQLTKDVIRLCSRIDKPLVVGWALPEVAVRDQVARLRAERIPVFTSFSIATRALAAAVGS
jgi:acetate---CoA ligase (ADP-forming)